MDKTLDVPRDPKRTENPLKRVAIAISTRAITASGSRVVVGLAGYRLIFKFHPLLAATYDAYVMYCVPSRRSISPIARITSDFAIARTKTKNIRE